MKARQVVSCYASHPNKPGDRRYCFRTVALFAVASVTSKVTRRGSIGGTFDGSRLADTQPTRPVSLSTASHNSTGFAGTKLSRNSLDQLLGKGPDPNGSTVGPACKSTGSAGTTPPLSLLSKSPDANDSNVPFAIVREVRELLVEFALDKFYEETIRKSRASRSSRSCSSVPSGVSWFVSYLQPKLEAEFGAYLQKTLPEKSPETLYQQKILNLSKLRPKEFQDLLFSSVYGQLQRRSDEVDYKKPAPGASMELKQVRLLLAALGWNSERLLAEYMITREQPELFDERLHALVMHGANKPKVLGELRKRAAELDELTRLAQACLLEHEAVEIDFSLGSLKLLEAPRTAEVVSSIVTRLLDRGARFLDFVGTVARQLRNKSRAASAAETPASIKTFMSKQKIK